MSKKRRFPRQTATSPMQLKAQEVIHHNRRVPLILESEGGQQETVITNEAEMQKPDQECDLLGHTQIKVETEDGSPVNLVVGQRSAGKIYGEARA